MGRLICSWLKRQPGCLLFVIAKRNGTCGYHIKSARSNMRGKVAYRWTPMAAILGISGSVPKDWATGHPHALSISHYALSGLNLKIRWYMGQRVIYKWSYKFTSRFVCTMWPFYTFVIESMHNALCNLKHKTCSN